MQPDRAGWANGLDDWFIRLRGSLGYGLDQRRQNACNASLRQAQALLRTAIDIDLSVKPLTAFYGLEQAGGACLAAVNKSISFAPRGHGLSYSIDSVRDAKTIGDVVITLAKPGNPDQGAFRMFAEAYGHTLPESASATLAQIWSSSVYRLAPLLTKRPLVKPLRLDDSHLIVSTPARIIDASHIYDESSTFVQFMTDYQLQEHQAAASVWNTSKREFVLADFDLMQHEPYQFGGSNAYLIPPAGTFGTLPSLLNTWVLLYGLSICARYLAGLWQLAINIDNSPDYVVLSKVMEHLCWLLPQDVAMMLEQARDKKTDS
jgi:hypothetical protein